MYTTKMSKTSSAIKQLLEIYKFFALCNKDVGWLHRRRYMDEYKRAAVNVFCPFVRSVVSSLLHYIHVYRQRERESFQKRAIGILFLSVDCGVFIFDFNLNHVKVHGQEFAFLLRIFI